MIDSLTFFFFRIQELFYLEIGIESSVFVCNSKCLEVYHTATSLLTNWIDTWGFQFPNVRNNNNNYNNNNNNHFEKNEEYKKRLVKEELNQACESHFINSLRRAPNLLRQKIHGVDWRKPYSNARLKSLLTLVTNFIRKII